MLLVAKTTPSKFTLRKPSGGRRHFTNLAVRGIAEWMGCSWWNSCRELAAVELIFTRGKVSSPSLRLFRCCHINEAVQANRAKQVWSCWASWITSKKLEQELVATKKSSTNSTCHTVDSIGHDQRAWMVSLGPSLQWVRRVLDIILLLARFIFVGRKN